MKKCPYCAEEIQDDSIKCKHCGEWLNNKKKKEGIGGWLIPIGIILWLNIIRTIFFLYYENDIMKGSEYLLVYTRRPIWFILVLLSMIRFFPLILLIRSFHIKSKYILRYFKQFIFFHFPFIVFYNYCDLVVSKKIDIFENPFSYPVFLGGFVGALCANLFIYTAIYYYLLKSERSKNTFILDLNPWYLK